MSRFVISRLALPVLLAAALIPAASFAQSQDTQSVADAARRARDQKKPPAKPAKVITDEDLKPAPQAGTTTPAAPAATAATASATAAPASATSSTAGTATPASPAAAAATAAPASATSSTAAATAAPASTTSSTAAPASAPAANSSSAPDAKDQKESKEVTELKAQIKQALDDLNLVRREQSLENDKYYSNTDYVHDTAGKAKLDELIQQATDKQQVLDRLKARLAALLPQDSSATAPPKP
jgi:hypothetical protein